MMQLLSVEWLKIRKYRTFWVLTGMFAVLIVSWNWAISAGLLDLGGGGISIVNLNYTYPAVWDNVAYWTKFFAALIAILVILLTTNEYQFRTNRQNVIDGFTRMQVYHSKWLLVLILSLSVTVFTFMEGTIFAAINGSSLGNFTVNAGKLVYVFLLTINYFAFALTLSLFIKKSGAATLLFLLYNYIAETMATEILSKKFNLVYGHFLPLQCSADLIPFPMMDMAKKLLSKEGQPTNYLIMATIAWLFIYYMAGRIKLKRTDW